MGRKTTECPQAERESNLNLELSCVPLNNLSFYTRILASKCLTFLGNCTVWTLVGAGFLGLKLCLNKTVIFPTVIHLQASVVSLCFPGSHLSVMNILLKYINAYLHPGNVFLILKLQQRTSTLPTRQCVKLPMNLVPSEKYHLFRPSQPVCQGHKVKLISTYY